MKDVFSAMGKIRAHTVRIQLTDSSQLLTDAIDTALGSAVFWDGILAAMISCEAFDARIAFGVSASGTVGHVLASGGSVRIPSQDMVRASRIINKTAGSNAIIQVTLEY